MRNFFSFYNHIRDSGKQLLLIWRSGRKRSGTIQYTAGYDDNNNDRHRLNPWPCSRYPVCT